MILDYLKQLGWKKILLIIIFLLVCLAMGYGMYYLFFRSEESKTTTTTTTNNSNNFVNGLPGTGYGQPMGNNQGQPVNVNQQNYKKVSDLPKVNGSQTPSLPLFNQVVVSPELNSAGNGIIFYNPADNKFYSVLESGEKILLSNKEFYGVKKVYWANDKNKAIIEYPDGNKILYDFSKNTQITLSPTVYEPSFNEQNVVAYKRISDNSDDNWITVSKIDGTETTLIEPLGDNGDLVQVDWSPTGQVVALYIEPIGANESEVYFIGLRGENFKSLKVDGSNFKGLWSPSGARLLYHVVSVENDFKPMLYITDAEEETIGAHKFSLGLSTWVDKCVFAEETILYCAVPKDLIEGAGLYPEAVDGLLQDLIYRVDISTGLKELIAEPLDSQGNNFNISRLYLSTNQDYLYFWNKIDEKVYALRLK